MKRNLTIFAAVALLILGIKYVLFSRTEMIYDVLISLVGLFVFYRFYASLHQDEWSYGMLICTVLLHDLSLYGTAPFGVRFDHYMHALGGFSIALIADRMFTERWSVQKRFILLIVVALGVGAIGEIIEWIGAQALGPGDGMLYYGEGDEGEWHNAMQDMLFNMVGATVMSIVTIARTNSDGRRHK